MVDLRVTTIHGPDTVLEEATVAAFKQSLRGPLIAPSDDSYDEARRVWNANIDRRPGLKPDRAQRHQIDCHFLSPLCYAMPDAICRPCMAQADQPLPEARPV